MKLGAITLFLVALSFACTTACSAVYFVIAASFELTVCREWTNAELRMLVSRCNARPSFYFGCGCISGLRKMLCDEWLRL